MHDTGVQKRGLMRAGSLLTILMGCAFMAFGLGLGFLLFGAVSVSNHSPGAALAVSYYRPGHSNANATAELLEKLGGMQAQIQSLAASLPATIEQKLKEHHGGPAQQQQQQQPQVPAALVHHVGQARSACDKRSGPGITLKVSDALVSPVVIVAHNRVHYLAKCLMTVLRYWQEDPANAQRFPLFVSVDGGDASTTHFASALNFGAQVQVIHNLRDSSRCKPQDGYCNLSVHYHMLLQLFFECHKAPRLIFLEEDLEVAPDFFGYFAALAPILDVDKSLLCVSAWNDHGQRGRASNATSLYRTDIFPGLGWMLTSDVGRELYEKWPNVYWDEYPRESKVRRGRQCVFPEMSRTHTFGKVGTSGGILFDEHLARMLLSKERVDWSRIDVTQYEGAAYAQRMSEALAAAQPVGAGTDLRSTCDPNQPDHGERGDMMVRYADLEAYKAIAKQLPPMLGDSKGDPAQPRASYKGIVTVRCRGRRLFIAPQPGSAADVPAWKDSSVSLTHTGAGPALQRSKATACPTLYPRPRRYSSGP